MKKIKTQVCPTEKAISFISSLGLLLIGISVAYYFVFFLPSSLTNTTSETPGSQVVSSHNADSSESSIENDVRLSPIPYISNLTDFDYSNPEMEKLEFVDILLSSWRIYNSLHDFFVESEYLAVMKLSDSAETLDTKWKYLDMQNSEKTKLKIAEINFLIERCKKNRYCQNNTYGAFYLKALSEIAQAQFGFYITASDTDGGENKNYFAGLSEKLIAQAPDAVDFFYKDNLNLSYLLKTPDIYAITEYANNKYRLIVAFDYLSKECNNVPQIFHSYGRYETYCLDQALEVENKVNELKSITDNFSSLASCRLEKKLTKKDGCASTENHLQYLQTQLQVSD